MNGDSKDTLTESMQYKQNRTFQKNDSANKAVKKIKTNENPDTKETKHLKEAQRQIRT